MLFGSTCENKAPVVTIIHSPAHNIQSQIPHSQPLHGGKKKRKKKP